MVPEGIFKKTLEILLQLNPGKAPRYCSNKYQTNNHNNQQDHHLALI